VIALIGVWRFREQKKPVRFLRSFCTCSAL
jgi:hypothetical protein